MASSSCDIHHEQIAGFDPDDVGDLSLSGIGPNGNGWHGASPKRDAGGTLQFEDTPDFLPNLTPSEVLLAGSFGGGYFRPIDSRASGTLQRFERVWEELPRDWWDKCDVDTMLASETYQKNVNRYKVNCGAKISGKGDPFGQLYWEMKGWINAQDPYGWFHWFCRFNQGRRSDDDSRQIARWAKCAGPRGRWRQNLIGKVLKAGGGFEDESVSPVVRQTLQAGI